MYFKKEENWTQRWEGEQKVMMNKDNMGKCKLGDTV